MKNCIVSLFLLSALFSTAQNVVTDTSATTVAYWNKGDKKNFHITVSKEKYKDNLIQSSASTSYDVKLEVLDGTDKDYTMKWTYSNINVGNMDPMSKSLAMLTNGMSVIYKTDEVGIFQEIVNYKEMQAYMQTYVKQLIQNNKDTALQGMIKQVGSMLSSRQAIEGVVLKDIRLYHAPFGQELSVKRQAIHEVELANTTGGAPFPATLSIGLSKLEPNKDVCKVSMTQTLDKVKGMKIVAEFLKKMISTTDVQLKDEDLPKELDMTDVYEFDMVLSTGWLTKASVVRVANALNSKVKETYHIALKN